MSTSPLSGARLRYVFIYAQDFARLVNFYRDALGLTTAYYEADQFAFFSLAAGGPDIALYPGRKTPLTAHPHWFITLDVSDIEHVVTRLRERGVAVSEIGAVPFGRAATFSDPEGNAFEIHEPANE